MALTSCKECGNKVSTRAQACPHCGAKPLLNQNVGCGSAIMVGILALVLYSVLSSDSQQPAQRPAEDRRASAGGACMEFIKRTLHDPSTAQFEHSSEAQIEIVGDRAAVTRTVRAKNALGAVRATRFVCLLSLEGGNVRGHAVGEVGRAEVSPAAMRRWLAGN